MVDAWPDHASAAEPCVTYPVDRSELLCRVYNKAMAIKSGGSWGCLSWNSMPSDGESTGGRFDCRSSHVFPYLYAAEASSGANVAIYETLKSFILFDKARRRYVIPGIELSVRALQYFQVSEDLTLAELSDNGLIALHAPELVCTGMNRDQTRAWGVYFREQTTDDIHGLAYNSTRATMGLGARSMILWGDRLSSLMFFPAAGELDLGSPEGKRLVLKVFESWKLQII